MAIYGEHSGEYRDADIDELETPPKSPDYVPNSQLGSNPIAATLANRNPELGEYPIGTYPAPIYYGPLIPGINGSQESLNQRGDPTDKDNFMLISFSYSYVIKTKNGFSRSYSWIYKSKSKFGKL